MLNGFRPVGAHERGIVVDVDPAGVGGHRQHGAGFVDHRRPHHDHGPAGGHV
jgi:hypothetical protein